MPETETGRALLGVARTFRLRILAERDRIEPLVGYPKISRAGRAVPQLASLQGGNPQVVDPVVLTSQRARQHHVHASKREQRVA